MVKIVILTLFIFQAHINLAQYSFGEVRSMVQNNIIAYHISELANKKIELTKDGHVRNEYYKGDWINVLMSGQKGILKMNFQALSTKFPNENIELYEVMKKGFHFLDTLSGKELLLQLPDHHFKDDSKYLIGVEENKKGILFISGNFFKTRISQYFIDLPKGMDSFLRFKLYNLGVNKVEKLGEDEESYSYKCSSISHDYQVLISKKNYDQIKVLSKLKVVD